MDTHIRFDDSVEYTVTVSYSFIHDRTVSNRYLIPPDAIKTFADRADQIDFIEDGSAVEFDAPETDHAFSSDLEERDLPLVVPISLSEFENGVQNVQEYPIDHANSEQNDHERTGAEIRLTTYGVASISFRHELRIHNCTDDDHVAPYIAHEREIQESTEELSAVVWEAFVDSWNAHTQHPLQYDRDAEYIDSFSVAFSTGLQVSSDSSDRTQFPLTTIKRPEASLSDDLDQHIKRKLMGIEMGSYQWESYTSEFVHDNLQTDLSTTQYEFQFVNWDGAFLVYSTGEVHKEYREYLEDMMLALELLFLIRSSLRLLDRLIHKHTIQLTQRSNTLSDVRHPRRLAAYYRELENFDRWLTTINGWHRFERFGKMDHFNSFLYTAADEMRIAEWLDTNEKQIDQLRGIYRKRSTVIERINELSMTVVLVVLTVVLTGLTTLLWLSP